MQFDGEQSAAFPSPGEKIRQNIPKTLLLFSDDGI
jgi:hypothetical protein